MEMLFAPLFSGSSGNSLFIRAGDDSILVDAGVSGSRITNELKKVMAPGERLKAILVTHEHNDHIQSVGILSRRLDLPVYATEGTWEAMEKKIGAIRPGNMRLLTPGEDLYIGNFNVTPFSIPHDAAQPVGFAFRQGSVRAVIATDLGKVEKGWIENTAGAGAVLLEANHDVEMLKAGRYPYELKRRILSGSGHLSNDDAAKAAVKLAESGVKLIILGHLSKENNFPELAFRTVAMALEEAGFEPGRDVSLSLAGRDGINDVFHIKQD